MTAPDPELASAAACLQDLASAVAVAAGDLSASRPPDDDLADLADRLCRAAPLLTAAPARVVFGGHFSCGKSSLVNALIGRRLLPTSILPETGVACWLTSGPHDSAVVVTDDGSDELPVDRTVIAHQVSLLDENQERRAGVGSVHRLEITLRDLGAPPGTAWLDSPGINDKGGSSSDRAAETAAHADLLCWVVPSHHAFSLQEQEVVAEQLARRGPAGVAFLVNVFLDDDDEQEWDAFLAHPDARGMRLRIEAWAAQVMGDDAALPPVLFVSARAALRVNPDHFGLPAVRALLRHAGLGSDWITATRLCGAARTITDVRGELQVLTAAERDRTAHADATGRAAYDAARETAALIEGDVAVVLDAAFGAALTEVEALAPVLAAELNAEPLVRDARYGDSLTAKLAAITSQLAARVVDEVSARSTARGGTPLQGHAAAIMMTELDLGRVEVAVPESDPLGGAVGGSALAGMATGAAMGSVVPIVGTAIGAFLGGLLAGGAAEAVNQAKATAADRQTAHGNARAAIAGARARLAAQRDRVAAILVAACAPDADPPDPVDRTVLGLLERALERADDGTAERVAARADALRPVLAEPAPPAAALPARALPLRARPAAAQPPPTPPDPDPPTVPMPVVPRPRAAWPPSPHLAPDRWRLVVAGEAGAGRSTLVAALLSGPGALPDLVHAGAAEVVDAPAVHEGSPASDVGWRLVREADALVVVLSSVVLGLREPPTWLVERVPPSTPLLVVVNLVGDVVSTEELRRHLWWWLVYRLWGGPAWSPGADLTAHGIVLADLHAARKGVCAGDETLVEASGLVPVRAALLAEHDRHRVAGAVRTG